MKTMKIKQVSLFGILGLFLITAGLNAQDIKLTRQEKKEVRKAQLEENFYLLDSVLNAKSFVLEAEYLRNGYGYNIPVVSGLNFVKLHNGTGILQTGSSSGMGYNGVGGVTAEGNIGSWEITRNPKKLFYKVRFSLLTNLGNYDVFMTVSANNRATATISGLGPGRLTWEGHLMTVGNARVFKGRNTI